MILQGNQRGGAKNLALHLLKKDNDHVTVHELRGFTSDNLVSALNESYAVSRGTKAKKFLFSLSLNPPLGENISTANFMKAITRAKGDLGLTDQPRAIVFHEKNSRRHCHVVWSRIDSSLMKAIPLPFTKLKLMEVSRDLYLEHGWKMPQGFMRTEERDPNNFTLAQWQQAKRTGKDPKAVKAVLRDCWASSDNQASFAQSLKAQGYNLAKGSRRAFVIIDQQCETFSVPRWVGITAKDVRAKLTDSENLLSYEDAKTQIASTMIEKLSVLNEAQTTRIQNHVSTIEKKKDALINAQKSERVRLAKQQDQRQIAETLARQDRFNKGIRGFVDRLTGRHRQTRLKNEQEMFLATMRDQTERDSLIFEQQKQAQELQNRVERLQGFSKKKSQSLASDLFEYREIRGGRKDSFEYDRNHLSKRPSIER